MLLKFPAQLHAYRKTREGDNLITFSVDRAYSDAVVDIVRKEVGTEFIAYLEDVTQSTNLSEDSKDVEEKFRSKFHALIDEYSKITITPKNVVKDAVRDVLKRKGMIKESTTELDIKGLATACNLVEEMIHAA